MKYGYSFLNKINQTQDKGLEDKIIKSLDKIKENKIEPDFVSVIKLCKRRKIVVYLDQHPTGNFFIKKIWVF